MDEQLLLHELALHLAKLHGAHAAAIGRELARGVLLEADEKFFRRGGGERGKEFFFKDGERAFQRLQSAPASGPALDEARNSAASSRRRAAVAAQASGATAAEARAAAADSR